MNTYYDYVKEYIKVTECFENRKYSKSGHTFCISNDYYDGLYWFYEADDFIIDIHDFFIKKEIVQNNFFNANNYISLSSSYIISANGESFNPYQNLSSNTLHIIDLGNINKDFHILLHENSSYLSVAINFKKPMIDNLKMTYSNEFNFTEIFEATQGKITNSLEPIARDILNCHMNSPAAEIFFEAKANEWLSIVIDTFMNRNDNSKISLDDNIALENVAKYLDDHFTMNVSQKTLEQIAMMSGTKLKKLFKEKYHSSITEYTQRKRMNMAETLLLNSTLKIKDIAKAVGYASHSKFTSYYKKYKGIYPKDIKRQANNNLQDYICENSECIKNCIFHKNNQNKK